MLSGGGVGCCFYFGSEDCVVGRSEGVLTDVGLRVKLVSEGVS